MMLVNSSHASGTVERRITVLMKLSYWWCNRAKNDNEFLMLVVK